MTACAQGEADLLSVLAGANALSPGVPTPPLPAPTERHAVLLQDRHGTFSAVLSMHRLPFWLVDHRGAQHPVVMYCAEGPLGPT